MDDWPLLSLLVFSPIIGCVFVWVASGVTGAESALNTQKSALWFSVFSFFISLFIASRFDFSQAGSFQFQENIRWFEGLPVHYAIGIDGVSLALVLLTTLLTPIAILSEWKDGRRAKERMMAFLVLETVVLGAFVAQDLLLFYVFFEAALIPMFIIIGVWGGARRVYASFKFFLYTFFGSIFLLLAILYILFALKTASIVEISSLKTFSMGAQIILWLGFFASFAVKTPMWPFHTWLPDAHVEAPTSGSIILAGILLKLGGYGFYRLSLPFFPDASAFFAPMMLALSLLALIFGSLSAFAQTDIKKIIAYSSVAHMGFVTAGLFSGNERAVIGALTQMLSHGVVSAALFLCVDTVYERMKTREISKYGGIAHCMPRYAICLFILTMSSIGLPGTSGFAAEFLTLIGVFSYSPLWSAGLTLGMVLGAVYMLNFLRRVVWGGEPRFEVKLALTEIDSRELWILGVLTALTVIFGLYPAPAIDLLRAPVADVLARLAAGAL